VGQRLIISEEDRTRISEMYGFILEQRLPIIMEEDDLCDILCGRKQAKFGSNGIVVKQIQHALNKYGFNVEKSGGGINEACKTSVEGCDGLFRKETKKAVEDFQRANGLTVDGGVGYRTLTKMGEKCIDLPKCNCKEETQQQDSGTQQDSAVGGRKDWWTLIDVVEDDPGCDVVYACLWKGIFDYRSNPQTKGTFNLSKFFACLTGRKDSTVDNPQDSDRTGKCKGCKGTYNQMPGVGRKPLTPFEQRCVDNGCSTVSR